MGVSLAGDDANKKSSRLLTRQESSAHSANSVAIVFRYVMHPHPTTSYVTCYGVLALTNEWQTYVDWEVSPRFLLSCFVGVCRAN